MNTTDHEIEQIKGASEGRVGADRAAMGLSMIPNAKHGDMDEVQKLRTALAGLLKMIDDSDVNDPDLRSVRMVSMISTDDACNAIDVGRAALNRKNQPRRFREHQIVILRKNLKIDDRDFLAGTTCTIVSVYGGGSHYAIEINADPNSPESHDYVVGDVCREDIELYIG
jgi:hypothetical protein